VIKVRPLTSADAEAAGEILLTAFSQVYRQRGHAPPFPNLESAVWLARAYLDLDPQGCALAEGPTGPVGVGFVHVRGAVASIGPLASRPGAPRGVGRALLAHLEGVAQGARSLRLFQDAFNPDSFGLYVREGYEVRDLAPYLLALELDPPRTGAPAGVTRISPADLARDLELLLANGAGLMYDGSRGVRGYLFYRALPSRIVLGPALADDERVLCTLLDALAATHSGRAAVMRGSCASPRVLRHALDRGFRVDHLGNLMVKGEVRLPPSQLYALFPESL
jgi:GNAT superfamily N-acetyltransferase